MIQFSLNIKYHEKNDQFQTFANSSFAKKTKSWRNKETGSNIIHEVQRLLTLSFNQLFLPLFYIGDGLIASNMAVYHSTIFCY